ncbi:TPA: hypothetical protein R4S80_005261 [Klebsiella michiganensis]|nr:hypothetical protein [Klebsiella michiganensis]
MTSKLTITDERMAELVAFRPLPGTDINSATRDEWMAMAAELQERRKADSEPVAWLWSRDDERDVSLTPPEDDDDAADAIEYGWTATPLYRHAQQPVVRPAPECQHQWRHGGANKLQSQKQCIKCGRVELGAQRAPLLPDAMESTIEAIKRILPTSNPDEYAACIGADMWNACRAAMLNGGNDE